MRLASAQGCMLNTITALNDALSFRAALQQNRLRLQRHGSWKQKERAFQARGSSEEQQSGFEDWQHLHPEQQRSPFAARITRQTA